MIVSILNQISINLTVNEFIELYTRTDIFGGGGEKKVKEPAKEVVENEEEPIVPEKLDDLGYIKNAPVPLEPTKLVNNNELAEFLKIGKSTVGLYRDKGMPNVPVKHGNKTMYMYDKNLCKAWYDDHKKKHPDRGHAGYAKKRMAEDKKQDEKTESDSERRDAIYYSLWKSRLNKICNDAGKDIGKMLSLTYKYMTKNYGIVWDQEEKEFKEANGYRPPSTTYLAFWLEKTKPAYKNLVASCLSTVIKENNA